MSPMHVSPMRGRGGGRVVPLAAMYGKIIITIVVLAIAWLVIRTRLRAGGRVAPPPTRRAPLVPPGVLQPLAYGLVSVMVAGTGLYLFQGWVAGREAVTVRVINANTGEGVTYQARREDVMGRSLRTLDGRRITLADVERMELHENPPGRAE
jgi:hypothetical protein